MLRRRFLEAKTLAQFIAAAQVNVELWKSIYKRAKAAAALVTPAIVLPHKRYLLVLLEDWCADAVNTIPVLARLAEASPNLELRVLQRDQNLDLMQTHLTRGTLSIPVVMVLDEDFREIGWWGPRPRVLQTWFEIEGHLIDKAERYRHMRGWYAKDRGESAAREVLEIAARNFINEAA